MVIGFVVLLIAAAPTGLQGGSGPLRIPTQVSFEDARSVIDRRCAACHSANPSITEFGPGPGGVSFDDPAQIRALAQRIRVRAVETQTMPLGNRTKMTIEERAILEAWLNRQ